MAKTSRHDWVIVGAGGFAREVAWQIEMHDANGGILMAVEPQYMPDPPQVGMYEVTTIADAIERSGHWVRWILGVGGVALRTRLVDLIWAHEHPPAWGALRSVSATIANDATLAGAYVGPGSVVSCGCQFDAHVLVNQCCSIGHDCRIHKHAVICPGCVLSGNVTIGEGAFLGSGVVVYPGKKIGPNAAVTAGTVVTHDVPANTIRYTTGQTSTMKQTEAGA